MFKALDRDSGRDLTIIGLSRDRVERLRPKGRTGRLCCPHCDGDVLVRAGEVLRWHFAHKNIQDCPLENEPAERLALRALLFEWLSEKYPGGAELEVLFPDLSLPRPVDAMVRTKDGRRFAYWVLTGGIRSVEDRWAMSRGLQGNRMSVHFVFSKTLLRLTRKRKVDLRPTEREFMEVRGHQLGTRLHYLDAATRRLTTLRGLWSEEGPMRHSYHQRLVDPFEEMLISPRTGALVHPGERDEYVAQHKKAKPAKKAKQARKAKQPRRPPKSAKRKTTDPAGLKPRPPVRRSIPEEPARPERTAICKRCGRKTPEIDQIIYEGKTGECECRSCVYGRDAGRARRPKP